MSFQGDVAGIGLANLLQSLARGRVGVLTLKSSDGRQATLGLDSGALHLLPEPGEEGEVWRMRVRRAWARDPQFGVDALRMAEVARAVRLESLYLMLESSEVHFRFAPGDLPTRPEASAASQPDEGTLRGGTTADAVFVNSLQLEGLLLEYARLGDELEQAGGCVFVTDDVVPVPLVDHDGSGGLGRYFGAADGESTLSEIGDRLSWTIRQVRLVTYKQLASGTLRLAEPHELLGLAQRELAEGNPTRAGARLNAWTLQAYPGPTGPYESEMLADEWSASRLQDALRTMTPRAARTLLRRLDHGLQNPLTAVLHWQAYAEDFKGDVLGKLHVMSCQVRGGEFNVPSLKDLLTVARQLRDAELPMRAGVFLRIAATRDVEGLSQRLEIGQGLLAVGYVPEAAPWIEEACDVLIERGQPDVAIAPLRELAHADRTNRNARRLLNRARARAVRKRITRKHAVIAVAIAVVIATSAIVQVRLRADYERRFGEVRALMQSPAEGLSLLDEVFSGDQTERIANLRQELERRARQIDDEKRSAWVDLFTEAQLECNVGDPRAGLQSALALPAKPILREQRQPWPDVTGVFDGLVARLQGEVLGLGEEVLDTPEQVQAEERLVTTVHDLLTASEDSTMTGVEAFRQRLDLVAGGLAERADERQEQRDARARDKRLSLQDRLLATARSHREAGDFTRAIEAYERLIEADKIGQITELLQREIGETRKQDEALVRAQDLAQRGRHDEARAVLAEGLGTDASHSLPWKVVCFPDQARAIFADGNTLTTPFELESRFGQVVSFRLESPGYDSRRVRVDRPADLSLFLSRSTELHWHTQGRVDALPVAVAEDHVVADRAGKLARVRPDGAEVWVREIPTLSGIARAPVFLPKQPDHLLLVTEDGEAWIVKVKDGSVDGPFSVDSPPFQGPLPSEEGVAVVFADGRELAWTTLLQPHEASVLSRTTESDDETVEGRYGSDVGLAVLRRRSGRDELTSPWTRWTVTVEGEVFTAREEGAHEPLFTVLREGEWTWMAWEAPSSRLLHGRLWVSDGAGLRSFQAP